MVIVETEIFACIGKLTIRAILARKKDLELDEATESEAATIKAMCECLGFVSNLLSSSIPMLFFFKEFLLMS